MYSIASTPSFEQLESIHQELVRVKGKSPIFTLVGNKCDKMHERTVSREEGLAMARQFGCDFMETSTKTAQNVERLFTELVRTLREHRDLKEGKKEDVVPTRPSRPKRKRQSDCVIL